MREGREMFGTESEREREADEKEVLREEEVGGVGGFGG